MKKLVKGNEAVVIGGLVAGCDAYFGYPITPASEIAHAAAAYFTRLGKIFIQAESEISAINMVYGASACGKRVMTASSGPGLSLKQECISFMAGAQLPAVIVDINRCGPGLGNIGPEQSDYFQVVKGGGHGNYRTIVLAPNSVAEMYEMTIKAFDLADRYRTPVYLLSDALLGQMMEPIDIVPIEIHRPTKPWRLDTTAATNDNHITSIYLDFDDMEAYSNQLNAKWRGIAEREAQAETYKTEDAEVIVTGFGIISRQLKSVVDLLREQGLPVGMIRPKTLWPFPTRTYRDQAREYTRFLVVELSAGQMIDDVRLAVPHNEIAFHGRGGGNLPTQEAIIEEIRKLLEK